MPARQANPRIAALAQSDIRAMTAACARVRGINMAQGVCDTPVPAAVIQGAEKAMRDGLNTYSRYDGLPELRIAIAQKLRRDNGILADPETDVTVSAGATGAFHCACLALLQPGDEVILLEPYYGYHVSALLAVEAVPKVVSLRPPDWRLVPADLERAVSERTKAVVINTPANPSGKVFTEAELEVVAAWAIRHDLFVFTDEIYEYFLFDGRRRVSLATLPGMRERTITIGGYSKTFSITGWRIGYAVSDKRWTPWIGAMNDLLYVCAPTPLQYGVAEGIRTLPPTFYDQLATDYQAKRDRFCRALATAGLPPLVPEGAYYILADVSRLPGSTGKERAMFLLDKTGVAGVPGEAFFQGSEGHRYVRFCFAKTADDLETAARRIEQLA